MLFCLCVLCFFEPGSSFLMNKCVLFFELMKLLNVVDQYVSCCYEVVAEGVGGGVGARGIGVRCRSTVVSKHRSI